MSITLESSIYESFTLPSKGLIYKKPINPNVTLRSMTTIEELLRCSQTDSPYKVMSDIIEGCMKEKPDIHVYDMCIGDYQFLLHKLRAITYGKDYKMSITCPNCGEITDSIADLDSIEILEYDDTYNDFTHITLPVTNKEIDLKYQTPRDLDEIARKNKEFQRKTKTNLDYSLIYTMVSMIDKVDGEYLNVIQLEEFCKKLPMKDVNFLILKSDELSRKVGLDTRIITKCGQCGYELVTSFRFTSEFFGPTAY